MSRTAELAVLARRAPPGDADWSRLWAAAEGERVSAWLARRWNGAIPAAARGPFEGRARHTLARELMFRATADRVIGALGARGVRPIPLKGFVLQRYVHPPGVRDMVDFDLLVRRDEVVTAASAIESLGFARLLGGDSGGAYVNSIYFADPGEAHAVHLHWHVLNASLPVGLALPSIPLEAIRVRARPAGPFDLLDPHDLFLTLCEHGLKHSFRELMHVVDVAALLEGFRDRSIPYVERFSSFDLDRAVDEGCRWGIGLAMYATLRLVRERVDAALVPERLVTSLFRDVRGLDGRAFVRSVLRGRGASNVLGYLGMTRDAASRVRFLSACLFPPRAAMRAFGKRSYAGRLWRGLRAAATSW